MSTLEHGEQTGLLSRIGNTPLVEIRKIFRSSKVRIFAKCEWFNPGGSVKDRAGARMVQKAEESGLLTPEKTILDATSGNTGIALAMIGALRGYQVELAMPENVTAERKGVLASYGARIHLTSPMDGSEGAIVKARELAAADPDKFFYTDQYSNPANWEAHFYGTSREIHRQTGGEITHFVAGIGTSGTFVGTSRGLKALDPTIQVVSFIPESPLHGLEGLKHIPTAMVPAIYDPDLADIETEVATEDAYTMARRMSLEEGLFVGPSSAAALVAAMEVAANIHSGTIVTVFPDSGVKYVSEDFWSN